jgi:hypothetical protein
VNVALLLLHAFIGAALIAHAMQKLFVFRLDGTAAYLRSFGFRAPRLMALAVIGTEFSGGILLGLGLLLPVVRCSSPPRCWSLPEPTIAAGVGSSPDRASSLWRRTPSSRSRSQVPVAANTRLTARSACTHRACRGRSVPP